MVSKKIIKSYDFDTIEDYFNYIIDSKINGQRAQAVELYKGLSNRQKLAFNNWVLTYYYYEAADFGDNLHANLATLTEYLNS